MANDKYANILTQSIEMSAANTLTFQEVSIGLSLFDKTGILISRMEYQPSTSAVQEMTANGDYIQMAVTASNSISSLVPTQQAVVHQMNLLRSDEGTAASSSRVVLPFIQDFSSLPGGGILITPKPWYIAMNSNGLASAATGYIRFYFTISKLTAESYFELLETRQYFG